ncbi:MAG TPA: tRNA (adenosine(37)-N6)-threonylcarbamoyltransferase complex transferase subunit TsaD [Candidatus Paceibacterota bacterium]|nr:tRNA (adenosine(37)-N6)-threonylcarbamoyltransferase complex transferase subunit TsaD [Candidatus Paceibacterota bacterium]
MKILGIETSCDESAVCLIDAQGDLPAQAGFKNDFRFQVLGNALISQIAIHAQYGGVFPNLAKREHSRNLVPLLQQVMEQDSGNQKSEIRNQNVMQKSKIEEMRDILSREPELYAQLSVFLQNNTRPAINAIAVTVGPGLEPALWVGINFARALSLVWSIPIVAVNHMEGHIIMSLVDFNSVHNPNTSFLSEVLGLKTIRFPMLSLLISGGHTELVLSKKFQDYQILGATRDDAVGEAFDKVARLLGLPYPGGAELSRLAEVARKYREASPRGINLPRPMLHDDSLDFSFAGLKTAVLRIVEANSPLTDEMQFMIAREFEDAVTDVLVGKTIRACDEYGVQTVVVGGGVSANTHIRLRLAGALAEAGLPPPLVSPPEFATDNALMIALAGYFRAAKKEFSKPAELRASGNLRLGKSA